MGCFRSTDPGPEAQQFSSKHRKKHPSERAIEEEFATRDYTKGKDEFGKVRFQYKKSLRSTQGQPKSSEGMVVGNGAGEKPEN
ncbi:hypothetical protein D9758_013452 [Tetrapyrgos nigripes]|uniref:Uncharacterized protein n=1 Tax=Tetrapyrgos nigripes TaxID=182062 RepID=A0A8H5CS19_9AGAR|nr:hypothetical protein D9758_013452 [Tetrapyrgos nigripes]